jgi:hypothetical protein
MLLAFEVQGYKLFDEKVEFSMHANMRFKKLKENIYTKSIKNEEIHALKSAIIYGPNNSGKTTFIKSVSALKSIIDKECIDDICSDTLNFNFFGGSGNIDFFIEFLSCEHHYEYYLSFNNKKEITKEILIVDSKTILDRFGKNNKEVSQILDLLGYYKNKLMVMCLPKSYREYYVGFKDFFNRILILQYTENNVQPTLDMLNDVKYSEEFLKLITSSDISIKNMHVSNNIDAEAFSYVPKDVAQYLKLESTYEKNGKSYSFPSILVDSVGTKKLIVYASYILKALKEERVLLVDELDTSWHTLLTRNIFALFNSTGNIKAQLIASCHDLLLLDDEHMFRRDQIWFTYKDKKRTYFYSLADFKVDSSEKTGMVMANYLKGKYGALPYPMMGDSVSEKGE